MKQIANSWRIVKSNKDVSLLIRLLNLNDWPQGQFGYDPCPGMGNVD